VSGPKATCPASQLRPICPAAWSARCVHPWTSSRHSISARARAASERASSSQPATAERIRIRAGSAGREKSAPRSSADRSLCHRRRARSQRRSRRPSGPRRGVGQRRDGLAPARGGREAEQFRPIHVEQQGAPRVPQHLAEEDGQEQGKQRAGVEAPPARGSARAAQRRPGRAVRACRVGGKEEQPDGLPDRLGRTGRLGRPGHRTSKCARGAEMGNIIAWNGGTRTGAAQQVWNTPERSAQWRSRIVLPTRRWLYSRTSWAL